MKLHTRLSTSIQLLVLCFVLIGLPILLLALPIRQVQCHLTTGQVCPDSVQTTVQQLQNRSLVLTQVDKSLSTIEIPAGYTVIKSRKRLPTTLVFTVQAETALFSVTCSNCDQPLIIGEHQHLLHATADTIPHFSVPHTRSEIISNQELISEVFEPLSIMVLSLYKQGLIFQNGTWNSSEEILLEIVDVPTAIVSTENIERQMLALAAVLEGESLSQIPDSATEIDLRFNLPVIRTR